MNRFVAFGIAIILTLIFAIFAEKRGITPNQIETYGNLMLSMIDTNNSEIVDMTSWTIEKIQLFSNYTIVASLEYGRIVESAVPSNSYDVTDVFVYVPNVPFPSSNVIDHVTIKGVSVGTGSNVFKNMDFYLFPQLMASNTIEIVTVSKD